MKIDLGQLSKLTIGEAEDFEEYAGVPLASIGRFVSTDIDGNTEMNAPMKVMTALIWIAGRREDRKLTIQKVREMTFDELAAIEWVGAAGQPGKAVEVGTAG